MKHASVPVRRLIASFLGLRIHDKDLPLLEEFVAKRIQSCGKGRWPSRVRIGAVRIRQGRQDEALEFLTQAAKRHPHNSRYALVCAVAMHDAGRPKAARAMLEQALERFPNDRELLATAADYAREAGDQHAAAQFARRFAAVAFDDPRAAGGN